MFKERNTKLTLLSLLSALVVASTTFAGVSIYAQQADDNMTTTEDSGLASNATSLDSSSNDTSEQFGVNASETSTAASIADIFSGLVICDLGTLTVGDATAVAADLNSTGVTPTITITVMDRTEVAAASENDTSTAADDTSSAGCLQLEGGTSTSNATDNAASGDNATSTSSTNATSTSNATSVGDASASDEDLTTFEEEALAGDESSNATSAANATDSNMTGTSSNATSAANATSTASSDASTDEGQVAAIDGKDFAPGQVVLVFTDNALVAVDDVDEDGSIDAKVPMENINSELRFVESGTMRTATASFAEGDTVIAGSADQDIQIVMAGDNAEDTETASSFSGSNSTSMSSGNATSTNSTSTNSTDLGQ